jgi:hypothetical protein
MLTRQSALPYGRPVNLLRWRATAQLHQTEDMASMSVAMSAHRGAVEVRGGVGRAHAELLATRQGNKRA